MDAVYVVRRGDRNEELRYSLRTLAANLPHDSVVLAGYAPAWTRGVRVLPVDQDGDKQTNALANLRAALEDPDTSDPFVLFNDDFFVMRPMDTVPALHRGTVDEVLEEYRALASSPYVRSMRATRDLLVAAGIPDPLSYELHVPIVVTKRPMLDALERGRDVYGLHNRTAYGNLYGIGGERMDDVKLYSPRTRGWESWPFLSTNDATFRRLPAGRHIRATFPDPSPYETAL